MRLKYVLLTLLTIGCLSASVSYADQGRVDITPRRVIIDPRERSGEFTLLNMSDKESTIRVQIINYQQDDKGLYKELNGPLNAAFNPEEVIRLSPRQFTLPPGGRQKVRFSIRKPADLSDGEYRFHIMASRMADYGPPAPVGAGEQSISIKMNISVAIPVSVRHGHVESGATLSDLKLLANGPDNKPTLQYTINRTGNASTYGTSLVYWQPQGGKEEEISNITNMNVFTENTYRHASVPLKLLPQGPGTLRLVYMNDETKIPYAEEKLQN